MHGVLSTTAGFIDGAEAVELKYDPQVVSYEELVELFFASHDPSAFRAVGEKGPGGDADAGCRARRPSSATAGTVRARVAEVATRVLAADALSSPRPPRSRTCQRRASLEEWPLAVPRRYR